MYSAKYLMDGTVQGFSGDYWHSHLYLL